MVSGNGNAYTKATVLSALTPTNILAPTTNGTYALVVVDRAGNVSSKSTNLITVNNVTKSAVAQPTWYNTGGIFTAGSKQNLELMWRPYANITDGELVIELNGAVLDPNIVTSTYVDGDGTHTITSSMLSNGNTTLTLPISNINFGNWKRVTLNGVDLSATQGIYKINFSMDQDGTDSNYSLSEPLSVDLTLQ